MRQPPPSPRAQVRRLPDRAAYDRETIHAILDEGLVCHVGLASEGQPYVIPMTYGRDGERLFLHGSAASRLLRGLDAGAPACVTVTLLDGLVLARSAFHHSANFRSVVVLGRATPVVDPEGKVAALRVISEHLLPGRWDHVRPPNARELAATMVLEVPLDEASAKIRTGPPLDDAEDLGLPVWAGVLPLALVPGKPVQDGDRGPADIPLHVRAWTPPRPG
jgi:nitroimidazol reductase NimA-like FMN-containing flavoprotein (pyridoxamine 5'-phosphate oxidase superfamily)